MRVSAKRPGSLAKSRYQKLKIIDAHIHIGNNPTTKYYTLKETKRDLREAGAHGACLFAFPEDMYRMIDSTTSRYAANEYVLQVSHESKDLHPFYFVWNDYLIPNNLNQFHGIKWHRHSDEPRYNYSLPQCKEILELITDLKLPVILEEEFDDTRRFIKENSEIDVIIPHMGQANGGYKKMIVFFEDSNVYFDTAVAPLEAIQYILDHVGPERIIFASDVSGTRMPFYNFPKVELLKLAKLNLAQESYRHIVAGNIERLLP
jgi:predicted TIM-barrel fold metal-dependent hydrolase